LRVSFLEWEARVNANEDRPRKPGDLPFVRKWRHYGNSASHLPSLPESPLGQMMTILTEFGVESRIEDEDYLQGLVALRKSW